MCMYLNLLKANFLLLKNLTNKETGFWLHSLVMTLINSERFFEYCNNLPPKMDNFWKLPICELITTI